MARARIPELEKEIAALQTQVETLQQKLGFEGEERRRAIAERDRANHMVRKLADSIKAVHGGTETEA